MANKSTVFVHSSYWINVICTIFGAGNLIFPAMLSQSAGENVWIANAGFFSNWCWITITRCASIWFSGKDDLQSLASRAHPVFGIVFTTVLYLAIGPLFAIPRTGNVSYEIGLKPFMPEGVGSTPLILFTIIFFSITCFSLNPRKLSILLEKS